jgi:hypothetical protein
MPFSAADEIGLLERSLDGLPLQWIGRYEVSLDIAMRSDEKILNVTEDSVVVNCGPLADIRCKISPVSDSVLHITYGRVRRVKEMTGEDKQRYLEFIESYLQYRKQVFAWEAL